MLKEMCARRHRTLSAIMLSAVGLACCPTFGQTIYVSTPQDIDDIRNNLSATYVQTADIDLTGHTIAPIGNGATPFTGSFDGQGYEIWNWNFNDDQQDYVGLFGATDGAKLIDITIREFNVVGRHHVAGLVGWAKHSTIERCQVLSGDEAGGSPTTVLGVLEVGGLAGRVEWTLVQDCFSEAHVECSNRWAGCLIGHVHLGSTIRRCHADGVAMGGNVVGGLTGNVHGSLMEHCTSRSTVICAMVCGGLTGWIQEDLTPNPTPAIVRDCKVNSYVMNTQTGLVIFNDPMGNMIMATSSTGGIAGWVDGDSLVERCTAAGIVESLDEANAANGGLLGRVQDSSIVRDSIAYADVYGDTCGGLIGWASDDVLVDHCIAYGTVHGIWQSGGLVGAAERCTIQYSHAYGDVFASGLAGNLHAEPGHLLAAAGGLVGYTFPSHTQQFHTKIHCSSAHGNVSTNGQMTGGLAGLLWGTLVTESYATGDVESTNRKVGGLIGAIFAPTVGNNFPNANEVSHVINCYATGNVQQNASQPSHEGQVGGLAGFHDARWNKVNRVENCYSNGAVSGSGSTIGGLIGAKHSSAIVVSSYWDIASSGQSTSDGGVGKTSAEMTQQSTFVDWNFTTIWRIIQGQSPPTLRCGS